MGQQQKFSVRITLTILASLSTGLATGTWTSLNSLQEQNFASLSKPRIMRRAVGDANYTYSSANCNETCVLPDCYCQANQYNIPGDLEPRHTPQIITVTYTGPLSDNIRKQIADIFPTSRKNPNGCPVAITLFIKGTFTDVCTVHEMYTRGHEIAIQSKGLGNPRDWSAAKWQTQVADYRYNISKKAYIPLSHIQGVRAPNNEPGGDTQFQMLVNEDFMYDSTLKAGPVDITSPQIWPFTLEEPFDHISCLSGTVKCPEKSYPAIWVVPSVALSTSRGPGRCTYLDECVADFETSEEIYGLLVDNFKRNYGHNRAPFQINLLETTFASDIRKQALKDFLDVVTNADDTWILPIQETLSWMRSPVRAQDAETLVAWECPHRNYHRACREERDNEKTTVTYSDYIDVDNLLIWQYVILALAYLVVLRYDRWLPREDD